MYEPILRFHKWCGDKQKYGLLYGHFEHTYGTYRTIPTICALFIVRVFCMLFFSLEGEVKFLCIVYIDNLESCLKKLGL